MVWCVAIPVIDTLQVMYHRKRTALNFRLGSVTHALPAGGRRVRQVTVMTMMLSGNALVIGLGLVLTNVSPILSLIVFIALGPIYANWTALEFGPPRYPLRDSLVGDLIACSPIKTDEVT